MMKMNSILTAAGICSRIFPECGEIKVVLYDDMDRIHKKDDIQFVEKLFAHNEESFDRFFDIVDKLNSDPVLKISMQITENYVVVFYKSPDKVILPRKKSMPDPLDYMD